MLSAEVEIAAPPKEKKKKRVEQQEKTLHVPQYHVILLDDNDHTYEYVIEMLMKLFGHSMATSFRMACEVDLAGRVIVDTCHKERAELKRDQIHDYGADWRISHCKGSMSATVEPVC
ncbi:MAG TPA: ATP-dependent Clp protease adaptor ClpS [Rhodothermales bacterium]|nr:ATP-dependent Clp protease adaptor ClpS [Rhodothermales bacterium]